MSVLLERFSRGFRRQDEIIAALREENASLKRQLSDEELDDAQIEAERDEAVARADKLQVLVNEDIAEDEALTALADIYDPQPAAEAEETPAE